MHPLLLGTAMFLKVFLMGFQSKNVVGNHYRTAFATSVLMGLMEVFVVVGITRTGWAAAAPVCLGGSIGIVLSMWTHSRLFPRATIAAPSPPTERQSAVTDTAPRLIPCPDCHKDWGHGYDYKTKRFLAKKKT